MTSHVSCGFDLRVNALLEQKCIPDWDQFLLVPDKRSSMSVDTLVWPEPEGMNTFIQDDSQTFWTPLGLASSLKLLIEGCRKQCLPVANSFPVCVTVTEAVLAVLVKRFGSGYFDSPQRESDLLLAGWRFLGFDAVALEGLHSGLKGIGFREPSWSQLRAQFGGSLNEVGLFSDGAVAAKFAETRGAEMQSHAPFEVLGLFVHDPISE